MLKVHKIEPANNLELYNYRNFLDNELAKKGKGEEAEKEKISSNMKNICECYLKLFCSNDFKGKLDNENRKLFLYSVGSVALAEYLLKNKIDILPICQKKVVNVFVTDEVLSMQLQDETIYLPRVKQKSR